MRTTTFSYDSAGRITSVVDPNSQYAYTYDNADRLLTVDDAGTTGLHQVTLTDGYDNVGNRTSLDDSLGGLTSYAYDVRDELTSVTQSGSGVTAKRADFAYDAAMRLTTLTRFSDLSGSTVVLKTRYSYDSADRLTTLSHQTSGGTVRVEYGYTLDDMNRLTGESRTWGSGASSDTLTYGYTNNDQLTSVSHSNTSFANESFGYDANGNRNTSGHSTGTNNRLTSDGTYNYAYDDEGNTTSKTNIYCWMPPRNPTISPTRTDRVNELRKRFPDGIPKDWIVIVYTHGYPGLLGLGYYADRSGNKVKEGVSLHVPEHSENYRYFRELLDPLFVQKPPTYFTGCSIVGKPGESWKLGTDFLSSLPWGPIHGTVGKTSIMNDVLLLEKGGTIDVPVRK